MPASAPRPLLRALTRFVLIVLAGALSPAAMAENELIAPALPPAGEMAQPEVAGPAAPEAMATPKPNASTTDAPDRQASAEAPPKVVALPAEPIVPPPVIPLQVMLDWYPAPHHAALLLARELGLFERRGLAVTLTTPADPSAPLKLLAAGRVDLALTRQPLLHLKAHAGLPLIRIATLVGSPLGGLLLRDNGEASPAWLAGKRLGYADEESRELLPGLLAPHGVRPDEVTLKSVSFGLAQAMIAEEVDAVIGGSRLQLPLQLADEGIATRPLRLEALGLPVHDGVILVAHRDRLGNKREALVRFIAALEEATAWMVEDPEAAWQHLAEAEPTLDTPANRETWLATLLRLAGRPSALDLGRYAAFEAYLVAKGHVASALPLEQLAIDLGAP